MQPHFFAECFCSTWYVDRSSSKNERSSSYAIGLQQGCGLMLSLTNLLFWVKLFKIWSYMVTADSHVPLQYRKISSSLVVYPKPKSVTFKCISVKTQSRFFTLLRPFLLLELFVFFAVFCRFLSRLERNGVGLSGDLFSLLIVA